MSCTKSIEELVKEQGVPTNILLEASEAKVKKKELSAEFEFIKASAIYTETLRDEIIKEKIGTYDDFIGFSEVKDSKYHAVKQYFRQKQSENSEASLENSIAILVERRRIINESLVKSGRVGDWGKDICGLPPLEITYPPKPLTPILPALPDEQV